uniref:Uncharacterized protein n=1 Tax=Arundo donax TaxID=35708 RepID=A0A0A9FFL5_ARUDO
MLFRHPKSFAAFCYCTGLRKRLLLCSSFLSWRHGQGCRSHMPLILFPSREEEARHCAIDVEAGVVTEVLRHGQEPGVQRRRVHGRER